QVCAGNFGEFCSIVGQEATEKLLFFNLCSDSLWGIRKACAECFMTVSNSTSPEVRRSKLSPLFINLISDQSRWVRQAAFQSLGRFISTFANPSSTGLHFREDGALPEVPSSCSLNSLNCSDISSCHKDRTITHTPPNQDGRATPSPEHVATPDCEDLNHFEDGHFSVPGSATEQADDSFNSFIYWREPLPDISEELEIHGKATSDQIQKVLDCLQPHIDDPDVQGECLMPECVR
uniref:Putative WW-binding domain-containing protein n=1 Tax=Xiphophorus couchianus TaxID=32473 RepID=A0A3B5MEN5_9TELE